MSKGWLVGGVLVACLASCGAAGTCRAAPPAPAEDGELDRLNEQLGRVGEAVSRAQDPGQLAALSVQQADLLRQVAARSKVEDRPALVRSIADCLHAAAVNSRPGDRAAQQRLLALHEEVTRQAPGSALAAYVAYREMQADHLGALASGGDITQIQPAWRQRLAGFAQAYPQADDAPQAVMEAAQVSEAMGRTDWARAAYTHLARTYPTHPLAAKAQGAVRRLSLEGEVLRLALPRLDGAGSHDVPFDIDELRGRLVLVYFWASSDGRAATDFPRLAEALRKHAGVGLELLCVNMDRSPEEARSCLSGTAAPGVHVFQRDGLEGRLATRYGLASLPKLILVGRDGRVLSASVEAGTVADTLAKHAK
jgi:hypothetical protein